MKYMLTMWQFRHFNFMTFILIGSYLNKINTTAIKFRKGGFRRNRKVLKWKLNAVPGLETYRASCWLPMVDASSLLTCKNNRCKRSYQNFSYNILLFWNWIPRNRYFDPSLHTAYITIMQWIKLLEIAILNMLCALTH